MDLLYFVLLVSSLIFIHESGHFAFAKIFGVKVLTFSIGFGPKVLRIRGKETEYCVGLLPFGGFVKMLEESKQSEPILPEDRHRTFEAQALWKRVVIVLAGPAMNLLFPIALYTSVFLEDEQFLPPTVGQVLPGKPADGKLYPGDRIARVDGEEVTSFPEIQQVIAQRAGKPVTLGVERDGKTLDVTVTPTDESETRELDIVEHVGRIGIAPRFPAAVIGVAHPDSPAAQAKLQTFDQITAINGRRIERFVEFVDALAQNRGDQVVVSYLRPVYVPQAMGGLCELAVLEPGLAQLTPTPRPPGATPPADEQGRAADVLARTGIESADMYVAFVPEASSEWRAGLRPGDRITSLDGSPQRLWRTMEDELVAGADRRHELTWTRDGMPMRGFFQLRKEQWDDEFGQHYERYVFRYGRLAPQRARPPRPQPAPARVRAATRHRGDPQRHQVHQRRRPAPRARAACRCRRVSGPITIYDIAGQAGAKGPDVLRLGDGAHLGQPGAHQPAADPGARRRPPPLLPLRGGAPQAACRCASGRWRAWPGWSC